MGKYIGRDNPYGLFERQALDPNGSDKQFLLEYKVGDTTSILVVSNGAVLQPDVDYSLDNAGTSIVFKNDPPIGSLYVLYLGRELSVSSTGIAGGDLSSLDDVSITSPEQNQILKYNGGSWVNASAPNTFSGNYNDLTNKPTLLLESLDARVDVLEQTSATSIFNNDLVVNGIVVGKGNSSLIGNTALGSYALASATGDPLVPFGPGDNNTAVGSYALVVNTTGELNVAVGAGGTLGANTTGSGNIAIGAATLICNTTGNYNIAVGKNALLFSAIGSENVAVGTGALVNCTGSGNLALGNNAGLYITTGSYNVIVGNNDGSSISGINNNVIISDGQGNVRIKSDGVGRVGINTSQATSQLHVVSHTFDVVGLIVKAAQNQNVNLIELKTYQNENVFTVGKEGNTTILPKDRWSTGLEIQLLNNHAVNAIQILKQTSPGNYSSIFKVTASGEIDSPTTYYLDQRVTSLENSSGGSPTNQLVSTVSGNFDTTQSPVNGVLTIDCSEATIFLGKLDASVTKWNFVNFTNDVGVAYHLNLIIDGNSNYSYGSQCSVNSSDIVDGILWNKGVPPQATNTTNIINFSIIKDNVGSYKIIGSGTYALGKPNLNFSYDPYWGPANISESEIAGWFDASDPTAILSAQSRPNPANQWDRYPVTNELEPVSAWVNKVPLDVTPQGYFIPQEYTDITRSVYLHQNIQNGKPGLYFSGNNNYFFANFVPMSEFTEIIVYKPLNKIGYLMRGQEGGGHGLSRHVKLNQEWGISAIGYDAGWYTAGTSKKIPTDNSIEYFNAPQQCHIAFHKFSTNTSSDMYENGDNNLLTFPPSGLDSTNTTQLSADPQPVAPLLYSSRPTLMTEGASGYIFEYILYRRALTKSEMIAIRDYLANKWGVSAT